ncbi:MAG: GntR family transcriptional regulator [Methylococcales bacterium]
MIDKSISQGICQPPPTNEVAGLGVGKSLYAVAKMELLNLAQTLPVGAILPSYAELAEKLGCSVAPIKMAARDLQVTGILSLRRGRHAKVLWNNSFSRSARSNGKGIVTRPVEMSCRPLGPLEQSIADEMGLEAGGECIVSERIRIVDGRPVALQTTYIHPGFFDEPKLFFLQNDVVGGSLSKVYAQLGFRLLSVKALLKPGLADDRERRLLELPETAPVLRSRQRTIVEKNGRGEVLEIMIATYTKDIDYEVERLPRWIDGELAHG